MAHQSLSDVQDILYEVFPYLDTEYYADQAEIARARKTLLHSALTCKNFAGPALDVLWSSLPNDQPLLELLRMLGIVHDVTTEKNSASGPIFVSELRLKHLLHGLRRNVQAYPSLDDPRTHPNWSQFQDYATRVRSITLDPCAPREVWFHLVALLGGDPVLPALRKAIFSQVSNITRDGLASVYHVFNNPSHNSLWLISPSVRELSVSISDRRPYQTVVSVVRFIVRMACHMTSHLAKLHVLTPWDINLDCLRGHGSLREVEIGTVAETSALEVLTSLPSLEVLSLSLEQSSSTYLVFDRVRMLALKGSWPHVTSFLDQTGLPRLYSFSATVIHSVPTTLILECADCFRTLSDKHSTQLAVLHVKCDLVPTLPMYHSRLAREPAPTDGTLSAMVEPLLSLHNLRDVSLVFQSFLFPYSSSDMQSFAEAWPNLETLRLEFSTQEQHRAGFESLVHFARKCPRLRALHLPEMDLAQDTLETVEYPEGQQPHPLRELDVVHVSFAGGVDLSSEMSQFSQKVFPYAATPQAAAHPIVVIDEDSGDRAQIV